MVGFLLCILIVGVCKHLRIWEIEFNVTVQKMKFSIKDFFSKCNQIPSFLKKSLMENFIFCAVQSQGSKMKLFSKIVDGL